MGAVLPSGTGLKFRSGPVLIFSCATNIVTSEEDEWKTSLRRHGAQAVSDGRKCTWLAPGTPFSKSSTATNIHVHTL